MTRKRRQHSKHHTDDSVGATRDAVRRVAELEGDNLDLDPASELFLEFAAPILLTAQTDQEFQAAAAIADFVWANTYFDSSTQVQAIHRFIEETGIPEDMIPWLLDVYSELAARKQVLVG